MALIRSVNGKTPKIHPSAFIAENATIIGDVEIGAGASIWYNVVLRGDVAPIRIGAQSNVQDASVIHASLGLSQTIIHERVTIGHSVILHGCEIKAGALVGMGSIVMDNAVIGEHSLVGAGSLVTEQSQFPKEHMILGRPAKLKRPLSADEISAIEASADHYLEYSGWYQK